MDPQICRKGPAEGDAMTGDYHISVICSDGSIATSYYDDVEDYDFALGTHFCPYEGDGLRRIIIGPHGAVFQEYHQRGYEE